MSYNVVRAFVCLKGGIYIFKMWESYFSGMTPIIYKVILWYGHLCKLSVTRKEMSDIHVYKVQCWSFVDYKVKSGQTIGDFFFFLFVCLFVLLFCLFHGLHDLLYVLQCWAISLRILFLDNFKSKGYPRTKMAVDFCPWIKWGRGVW